MTAPAIDPSAEVADTAAIGPGTAVWAYAQVREGAEVGSECVIGRGACIDRDVRIGDRVKIQANALIYSPAVVEDGVFIGPAAVLTNDRRPRATDPCGERLDSSGWTPTPVRVGAGASIGASATCVAPLSIGRWAMVAAGAVVVRDVPDHALVAGNPARQIGWVGRSGHRLREVDGLLVCPVTSEAYRLDGDGLVSAGD